jgi:phospholipid transport system substrate-binding protein
MTTGMVLRQAAAVLALALAVPGVGLAGAPAEQIGTIIERVVRVVEDPALRAPAMARERRAALRRLAGEVFDFTETARRCLGRHWQARTPAEQEEFVRLFTGLLERAYMGKIESFAGEKVSVVGEAIDGDQATVRTRLVTRQGTEIPVDYRMHLRQGRWAAYDVLIENVSLVANYRAQFDKVVATASFAELVKRLRAKLEAEAEAPRRTSQR